MTISEIASRISEHYENYERWYKFVIFPILTLILLYSAGIFSVYLYALTLRLIG